MLKIYNTLNNRKEVFEPITPGQVQMYVCGMTVYDYCHIGHARVLVVFDVVYRYLKHLGYEVTYVRNITDIEDKIISRAIENGEAYDQLTERFIRAMHEDSDALGVLRPDVEPRATEAVDEMLKMIEVLLRAGERVAVDIGKRDPLDFVLWKSAKPDEPSWPSKYGDGRPGWHIECSAMSRSLFGNHFDIHGGGQDLQFPHHENEIAQSECCNDEKFVNYWMHNGFVRVNEEKMSKSLGNFFILREVLDRYRAEEIRYFIVSSHYRSPLNYSEEQLDNARSALQRLYAALLDTKLTKLPQDNDYQKRFEAALDDDFNTANAVAVLFDLVREINRSKREQQERQHELASLLRHLGGLLGLLQADAEEFLKSRPGQSAGLSDTAIEDLISARLQARADKDWASADRIRDELSEAGIVIEDGNDGTRWRRA